MDIYKISKNGIEYTVELPSDKIPYAINFQDEFPSVAVLINKKPSKHCYLYCNGKLEDKTPMSPPQVTLISMFRNSRDTKDIKTVTKHRSKNWCLVLINGKIEGWFESSILYWDNNDDL